jgi:hypothetical protein
MPKKNKNSELATWFWKEILGREDNPWSAAGFPRYLAEARRALKILKLDPEILKESLRTMQATGRYEMKSMLLPTLMAPSAKDDCWYDFVRNELETPPPVWERHAFTAWCKRTGNEHLLESLI